jgi:hypothetical protein
MRSWKNSNSWIRLWAESTTKQTSIPTDLEMLRKRGGRVALVGFLEGFTADWSPSLLMTLIGKEAHVQ